MAGYSRRNRNGSNGGTDDDFDWESFDRQTSADSASRPLRRRRSSETHRRRVSGTDEGDGYDTGSKQNRKKAVKRKKRLTEQQIMVRKRVRTVALIACLVVVVICSGMFVGMYAAVSREIEEMNIRGLALNSTSTIYYTDSVGNEQELDTINSATNRIWVDSSEISQTFKDAIVSIEDERFYKHGGVDIKRTLGATVKYVGAKLGLGSSNYGGSTITQQVIKNITREDDFKATRKIKEMMRAIALERQLSKDEILTLYCNIVYFANNCNGVEAAAKTYFNKSASELNLQEAASIAGITQYPAEYDPLAHPDKNVEKRNVVLKKMLDLGKITEAEYDTASAAPLLTSNEYRKQQQETTSYFVDQLINDAIRDLMDQKHYTEDFATSQVYNGGYKIYATIDTQVQDIMENVFENTDNFPGGDESQAAMVVLDPYTGQIKGLIGGLGEKTDVRGWNRATQAVRQPGSSIKPLSVYGPAVDRGDISESDIIVDEEIIIGNDNWQPKNSYDGFKGAMTVKEAVGRSSNIPAVKVLDKIGLSVSFGYLQNKFHLSTVSDEDKNYSSLALGGLTQGVTVKEMAAAYGVFANNGKYITPYTYTKILDSQGNTVLENYVNEQQALSDSAAYIMADLLSAPVNESYGTARKAQLDCEMPAYGKTGTTDDDYDKWFVGFTPYYVGAVWFGFDTPSSLSKAGISGNPCVTAWNLVFEEISESQEIKELEIPSSVVEVEICTKSGKLANDGCKAEKAYFVDGTQPKEYCENHYNLEQSSGFYKQDSSVYDEGDNDSDESSGRYSGSYSDGGSSYSDSGESSSGGGSSSSYDNSSYYEDSPGSSGYGSSSGSSSGGSYSSGGGSSGYGSSGGSDYSGSAGYTDDGGDYSSSGGDTSYSEEDTSSGGGYSEESSSGESSSGGESGEADIGTIQSD